jgi:hypothetical protein
VEPPEQSNILGFDTTECVAAAMAVAVWPNVITRDSHQSVIE